MSLKMTTSVFASAALAAGIAAVQPATAGDWNDQIGMCVAAAEEEGIVDTSEYRAKFDGGSRRRLSLVFISNNRDDEIQVECRIARGRVVSVTRTA